MAKTEAWPGFGQRVRERLRVLGYIRPDGKEDIARFTLENRYVVTLFYKYLTNTTPSRDNLLRLAKDLSVSPAWLLFGEEPPPPSPRRRRPVPIRGGAGEVPSPSAGDVHAEVSLIRRWLRAWAWPMHPLIWTVA